jgi:hypothetical protein
VVDRARAFKRLVDEFGLSHGDVGKKVGKSRVYVSNSLRVLMLSEEILAALSEGKITEGHTRPILMLVDRPEEQKVLFKEIMAKKINVRDAELIARKIATERSRIKTVITDPELAEMEVKLVESLGTRVHIERKGLRGTGKITIDFFSKDDLKNLFLKLEALEAGEGFKSSGEKGLSSVPSANNVPGEKISITQVIEETLGGREAIKEAIKENPTPIDDRPAVEKEKEDNEEDLYSAKNFTI